MSIKDSSELLRKQHIIPNMRILAIDFGEKNSGLAISDPNGTIALPLKAVSVNSPDELLLEIQEIVKLKNVEQILIGLPKLMHNKIGKKAQAVLEFKKKLEENLRIPVIEWDERLTTKEAEKSFEGIYTPKKKRKDIINKTSAQIILQSYLDYRKSSF